MVTAGPMASDGVATEESSRAPSSKFVHHRNKNLKWYRGTHGWGGKPRHLVVEGGKGKNGNFGRKGGNQKSGGEASNSNGWLGGARGERHPQSGETRHCRFGTHCKYMHKYCPFVHVHTGDSPTLAVGSCTRRKIFGVENTAIPMDKEHPGEGKGS